MDRVRAKLGGRKAAKSSAHHDDDRATPPEDSDSRRARDMGEGRSSDSAGSSSGGGRGGVMGLTQLWPDPAIESISKVETDVDVIAIHGLGGHPFKTWSEGEKLWLRDFLPYSASKTRIMTFGYNSAVAFSGSRSTIRDFAIQLLEDIKQVRRRDKESERKIIFICHSLGGIVFKQALIVAHEKEMRYRTIGDSVTGVVFLGTPHRGADIAYWTKLLAKFANVPLLGGIRKDLLGSLEPKSKELGTICAQFVERGMKLQIFSLYERHNLPGLGSLVVDDFSAILHLPNETPIPIDADHRSMCRYLTSSDRNYLTVANCIGELIDATSGPSTQSYVDVSVRNFLWFYLRAVDATAILERIPVHWGKSSRWFMEHPEFKSWTTPAGRQAIWLFGPPGSGKTVLLRSVIASLSARADDRETSVICKPIYFFFDDKDPSRRTSDTFVRSVLKQILEDTRTSHVFRYLEGFDFKTTATNENGLWKCLSAIVEKSRGIMFQLVIDAVDEVMRHSAGSPDNIIDRLQRLLALDPSGRLRLMISDRRPPSYEFSRVADVAPISIDNDDTKSSVQEWVEAQVRKSLEASKVAYSAGEPLEERIMDVSQSNFLYARLAWEQASAGVKTWSRQRVKEAIARLDTVSHDLIEVYCRLLKTIPATYKERAKIAFTVLRLCREGLTFEQLAFLEALHGEDFSRRTPTISEVRAKAADLRQYLSEACGYLVRASKDGMVNFTHVSVKDVFSANLEDVPKENRKILTDFSVSDQAGNAIMLDL
ncbi:hypothetical protein B0T26DRAFT_260557 [Lasiosphaeria miniovina]|uniref:NACHT domain-containing protein n=1 Tax=Lasiosphaeria miniovina TaxID=1954250 RepID=A0AA40E1D2_9PEZI|nr:uncharacterized protein B0T26DRAFT_260557 [Lasiosphaeria miniovina]KAK0723425.1 hypothetical protein B0T26DRAFT_260557 [Lasiosphaeria miniovina]